jgi:hypothetical protein
VGIDTGSTTADRRTWRILTVPASEKDRLLLALLEKNYRDNSSVISSLKELLDAKDIPFSFHSY